MSRHYQMRAHKAASAHTSGRIDGRSLHAREDRCSLTFDPFPSKWSNPARSRRRRVSGRRCSHDSATPDAFTFTMRYPVEEALRANALGGIAEIAHGI